MPHLALVAMPWSDLDRPSGALAALAPYVRRECPRWTVSCHSEYLRVAVRIGKPLYAMIAESAYKLGDPLYCPLLYPEKRGGFENFVRKWREEREHEGQAVDGELLIESLPRIFEELAAHIDEFVSGLSAETTVVGLTTCFGQLFPNLALARAVKTRLPEVKVVLGGSTVSGRAGPPLLGQYPFVDYVVQGEGERPLAALLKALERGDEPASSPGLLARADGGSSARPAEMSEVQRLDDLPIPDYEEFDKTAGECDVDWVLPIEGSRGCWWDRTKRSNNPRSTCYFCNLNMQWSGYREKSAERIVREVDGLSDRYGRLRLYFLDNIIRHRGVVEFAEGLKGLERDFEIFYEARANIRPYELLVLWEAGLRITQFGIEALSNSLLRRIGKGTTVIQNLSVMRLCAELGIQNGANLIIRFPGSTPEEVAETCETISSAALSFTPLHLSRFHLGIESTIDVLRDEFGIINVRNEDFYRDVLPDDVYAQLQLCDLSYDERTPSADWSPVKEAVERWRSVHRQRSNEPLLRYWDGGNFVVVEDLRGDDFSTGTFRGLERDVFLHCMEPRGIQEIQRRFCERGAAEEILERFVAYKLMYTEGEGQAKKFLSLPIAASLKSAVRRIRAAWEEEKSAARPKAPPGTRLEVIA